MMLKSRLLASWVGGYCFYLSDALGRFAHKLWRRSIQIVSFYSLHIVQNTGAPTTHDKPGSLTCKALIHGKNKYIYPFGIF